MARYSLGSTKRGGQERLKFKSNESSHGCEKLVDAKGDTRRKVASWLSAD
jgi:hypothetical protein